MTQLDHLALYQMENCPYCVRVRQAMADLGLAIELREVNRQPKYRQELVAATGRGMVPCLRIQDNGEFRWMHESRDIIAYLRDKYGGA